MFSFKHSPLFFVRTFRSKLSQRKFSNTRWIGKPEAVTASFVNKGGSDETPKLGLLLDDFFFAETFALNLMQCVQGKYKQNQKMFPEGLLTS